MADDPQVARPPEDSCVSLESVFQRRRYRRGPCHTGRHIAQMECTGAASRGVKRFACPGRRQEMVNDVADAAATVGDKSVTVIVGGGNSNILRSICHIVMPSGIRRLSDGQNEKQNCRKCLPQCWIPGDQHFRRSGNDRSGQPLLPVAALNTIHIMRFIRRNSF